MRHGRRSSLGGRFGLCRRGFDENDNRPLGDAVADVTGAQPAFSTGGGTSDARFIKNYCPVAELGLVGESMHKVDEQVPVADIATLTRIYLRLLERYFDAVPA